MLLGLAVPSSDVLVDYLVVAGGGGGGHGYPPGTTIPRGGAGGGAGGVRCTVDATGGGGSVESSLNLITGVSYTVTVGNGGASKNNGENSVFHTITSTGGGRGSSVESTGSASGGSGGGGTYGAGSAGTANQGFAGGTGADDVGADRFLGGAGPANSDSGSSGGSGVVILRFPSSVGLTVGAGLTYSSSTVGDNKVYTFTAGSDTVTFI